MNKNFIHLLNHNVTYAPPIFRISIQFNTKFIHVTFYRGNNKYLPILITGDFNSIPNSPLYKLIADGMLKYEGTYLRSKMINGKKLISPQLRITGIYTVTVNL